MNIIIIGTPISALKVINDKNIDTNKHRVTLIVDTTWEFEAPYYSFKDDYVQSFYHGANLISHLQSEDFNDYATYFTHLSNQLKQQRNERQKKAVSALQKLQVSLIKGKIDEVSEKAVVVDKVVYPYDKLLQLEILLEKNLNKNPLIFTFAEILESEILYEHILLYGISQRSLEWALLLATLGAKVSLISENNLFLNIDHLAFRDAIKEHLMAKNIVIYHKLQLGEMQQIDQKLKVELTDLSALAFELAGKKPTELVVDALVKEGEATPISYPFGEKVVVNEPFQCLYLNPEFVSLHLENETVVKRLSLDCADLSFYMTHLQIQGGLEIGFNEQGVMVSLIGFGYLMKELACFIKCYAKSILEFQRECDSEVEQLVHEIKCLYRME